MQGPVALAHEAAARILARAPDNVDALLVMGLALVREGQPRKARLLFEKGAALSDAYADFHLALGRMAESEGRLEEARRHGATDTRVAADDTVDWLRSETGGFGADFTFEATGNVKVMQQAVESAREAWGLATMIGVAGGLAGALLVTRALSTLLFGVTTTDPLTFAAVAGTLGIVALLASYLPARRAGRVDPMAALRTD